VGPAFTSSHGKLMRLPLVSGHRLHSSPGLSHSRSKNSNTARAQCVSPIASLAAAPRHTPAERSHALSTHACRRLRFRMEASGLV
jgi:hypothetical protein